MAQKLAIVTGASSGIGAATARALGKEGWKVILVARRRNKLEEVSRAVPDSVVEPLDASDGEAVMALAERIRTEHGVPDLIINSAGAGRWRSIEESSPKEAHLAMEAPYFAAFNFSYAFAADMLKRGSGHLIHINSPAPYIPWPGAVTYSVGRWALRGLNESLHQDLKGTGVKTTEVVFAEVSSTEYFTANPDSHQRLPKASSIIPVINAEQCTKVILKAVRKPRRLVLGSPMLRVVYWTQRFFPGPARWLLAVTGYKRPK